MADNRFLEGKTAFVTGASMNLGAVTAHTLAEHGADVAINHLVGEPEPVRLLESLRAHGHPAYAIAGDMAVGSDARRMADQALDRLGGRIDILVNNAGPFNADPFVRLAETEWDRIMNVNLKAAYLMAQAAAPGMQAAGS